MTSNIKWKNVFNTFHVSQQISKTKNSKIVGSYDGADMLQCI